MTTVAGAEQQPWRKLAVWTAPDQMDLAATKAACPCDDLTAARLLHTKLYPGLLHYVPGRPGTLVCVGHPLPPA